MSRSNIGQFRPPDFVLFTDEARLLFNFGKDEAIRRAALRIVARSQISLFAEQRKKCRL